MGLFGSSKHASGYGDRLVVTKISRKGKVTTTKGGPVQAKGKAGKWVDSRHAEPKRLPWYLR